MPRAFLAVAACEHVFRLISSKLESKRAEEIVKETLELAIAEGCKGKALPFLKHEYYVGKSRYEFDVATRDKDHIVLFD